MVARNQKYSFNAGMDMETGRTRVRTPPSSPNKSCWTRRSALERTLIVALVILTVLVIAVVIIMAIFAEANQNMENCGSTKTKSGTPGGLHTSDEQANGNPVESSLICDTPQCVDVAYRMIHSMDRSVNPCDNFHKYACGGWQKANNVGDGPMRSIFSDEMVEKVNTVLKTLLEIEDEEVNPADDLKAFQKARQFYRSCMLESAIEIRGFQPVKKLLDTIGRIYDEDSSVTNNLDLTDLLYQLLIRNGAPFFDISTDVHPANSSIKIIFISLPSYSGIISEYKYRVFMHRAMAQSLFEEGMMSPKEANLESENITDNDYAEFFSLIKDMNVTIDGTFLYKYMKITINKKTDDKMFDMLQSYFQRDANDTRQSALEKELEKFIMDLRDYVPTPKELQIADEQDETDKMFTIGQLQGFFEEINWKMLLEKLYKRPLGDDETIFVSYPHYLKDLQKLFRKYGPRVINNAALALYARDVLWELIYSEEDLERWQFCVDATKMVIPQALAAMYVRSFPREHLLRIQSEVSNLFENIKRSFQKIISSNSWMDSSSKDKIIHKLERMTGSFVSTDDVYNNTLIDMSVKNITIDEGRFFENVISSYELNRLESFDPNYDTSITKSEVEDSIMGNPFTINAYYLHSFNNVAVTLGLLSPPYYALDQPKYVTYGSLGTTIGHEITHGFDTTGIKYNEYGSKVTWMPSQTSQLYQARGDCFRKMYETAFHQTVEFLGGEAILHIDGNFTLNENMADNSGIDIAFQAYQSLQNQSRSDGRLPGLNLTQEQVFFLSAAQSSCVIMTPVAYIFTLELDEHTPEPERVNAFLMNSDTFAKVFQCPSGSPMNPQSKCRMW